MSPPLSLQHKEVMMGTIVVVVESDEYECGIVDTKCCRTSQVFAHNRYISWEEWKARERVLEEITKERVRKDRLRKEQRAFNDLGGMRQALTVAGLV